MVSSKIDYFVNIYIYNHSFHMQKSLSQTQMTILHTHTPFPAEIARKRKRQDAVVQWRHACTGNGRKDNERDKPNRMKMR